MRSGIRLLSLSLGSGLLSSPWHASCIFPVSIIRLLVASTKGMLIVALTTLLPG